ncbi:hypothetical protein [Pelagibius sp. Alg239-R121]|uniref:helix-turn-helix transcriptional regulator n=1 Tax=Pelagibius sp. Alg239-R121 TaxID=2993448 RepID=UPI0024A6E6FF|nr:hypothetical protein [Pelagibius sp. Alg239-R121]
MKSVHKIIEKIYEASTDDGLWPGVMQDVRHLFNGARCLMFTPHVAPTANNSLWASLDLSANDLKEYVEYYHTRDLWSLNAETMGYIRSGTCFIGQELIDDKLFEESEYFNDYTRYIEVKNLIASTVHDGTGRSGVPRVMMSVYGGLQSDAYTNKDLLAYQRLVPHVQNSLVLRQKFISLQSHERTIDRLLDSQPRPVLILKSGGTVVKVNEEAEDFLRRQSVLNLRSGQLRVEDSKTQREIDRAIWTTANSSRGNEAEPRSSCVQMSNPASTRPYNLTFYPIPSLLDDAGLDARVLLEILDPNHSSFLDASVVSAFYDLTNAERALCESLLAGYSLISAACRLGITEGTARQRLKLIFRKTDTRSQPDLIRLLMTYSPR